MESNSEAIYCVHKCTHRCPDSTKKPEPTRRNFDSRQVSKSVLKEILSEIHKVNDMPPTPSRIIKIKKAEVPKDKEIMIERKQEKKPIPLCKSSSMSSLIMWNVSKALDLQPSLDLKHAIMGVKQRLDTDGNGCNVSVDSKDHPEEQHLLCALLAWQQLGHHNADSLYSFVELKKEEMEKSNHRNQNNIRESIKSININRNPTTTWKTVVTSKPSMGGSFGLHTTGPVVRLPVESVVMQLGNDPQQGCSSSYCQGKQTKRLEKDIRCKLNEAGALDSTCAEALATLDSTTSHLRARAGQLARREARRVQLLERAEAAWVDLEAGYQKRFALAQEKEDDLKRQLKKMIEEVAQYKNKCTTCYPQVLKRKELEMMEARAILTNLETEVCDLASTKLTLSEESARAEAALAEEQCRSAQYERDLKFKEEQARRLLESVQHEAEGARVLTCEAERAMRAELAGLRKQIGDVSKDLLKEDNENLKIKKEHDQLRKEKAGLIEDLEGCRAMCDKKMQGQLDELKKKKELLLELAGQYLKCQCQMPMDKKQQVERTPSLAAMCYCEPEDNLQESCSCTSMQNRLLSSLLSDLFSGLQGELSRTGSQMPCQLLKCLQDNHSWDRPSDTKTNLRNFFSKLLKSELDIAIATSIENYHAKWVGNACADSVKMIPTLEDDLKEGWQGRAIERRAQQMANSLAEEILQERTEEIEKRTLERIKAGPPPCVCKPSAQDDKCTPDCCSKQTALFSCLVRPSSPFMPSPTSNTNMLAINQQSVESSPPAFWKQTIQEVTQLKQQIENLKQESVNKEDLKLMKDNISKLVRETLVIENQDLEVITKDSSKYYGQSLKKEPKCLKAARRDEYLKTSNKNKLGVFRSSATKDNKNVFKKVSIDEKPTKLSKRNVHDQSYAVNLCLCGPQQKGKSLQNARLNNNEKWKPKSLRDVMPQSSIVKQIKPISFSLPTPELTENSSEISELCKSDCKCFRKMPSNTSIDNLLETLATCSFDLVSRKTYKQQIKNCLSKFSPNVIKEAVRILSQNDSKNVLSFLRESHNTQVNAGDILKQNYSKKNETIITESNKNQLNVSCTYEDTPMKISKQNRSFTKQPATTESEYMGTVYLDKSHENICKCLINLAESEHEKYENGNNVPFQCINTNTCGCTLYQEMQKDNKRSQTEEFTKEQVQSYQCQVTRSKIASKFKEFNSSPINSNYLNSQREIKLKSDLNNVPQNTELYSSGGECCIKFLGVTLDDLNSIKNKKTKPMEHNVGDLIIPKEKHVECGRKLQKKSSNIEQSNSLPKHNVLLREKHYQTGFDNCTKCECKAKFEEFTGFMNNFLDNKLLENTHTDKGFDTKSLKELDNRIGSCVSCNGVNVDDCGDLELNAFHLLEDHIKQKFEDYKSFSCNICISPEEEQKFYSTILQRVKQVISDYANKMKCGCSKRLHNGSWDRAYGLLQEYLKIKIKRVQCLCVLNENKRDVILPEVLEKVCNLIESDFQRLRDICTCKNSTETRTKIVRIGDLLPPTELPEKDTNISHAKYNDVEVQHFSTVKKYSKQISNNSIIHKKNESSQPNPTFGVEATSCAIMAPYSNRNIKSTETDHIFTESKSNGVMYNTCDCCHNTDKVDIQKFPEMFGTKEVLVKLYTEKSVNKFENCELPKFGIDKEPTRCVSAMRVKSMETITVIQMSEHGEIIKDAQNRAFDKHTPCAPYIGFTVDCTCDSALGPCFCMKSVVQANNDKIDTVWKEFVGSNNNNTNFPYIMHGTQKINKEDVVNCHSGPDDVNFHSVPDNVLADKTSKTALPSVDIPTHEVGSIAEHEEDIVLKHSVDSENFSNQVSNTIDECLSLDTADTCSSDVYPVDWHKIPVPINSGRSNAVKLANSIYYPGQIQTDNENNSLISESGTNPVSQKMSETCGCQKVPICHVKMLVEHIEKNLIELKCTCDSLVSKVCPVHSKRVF